MPTPPPRPPPARPAPPPESDETVLEGSISVLATLTAGVRPVHQLLIDRAHDPETIHEVTSAARAARVPVQHVERALIDARAGGSTHGGVLAFAGERRYLPLSALTGPADGWVAMLDGIEDPFNYGQSVRALYAAGAAGLVIRPRTWRGGDGVIVRSSAGATELMPTAQVPDPDTALAHYQKLGWRVAVTARDRRAVSLFDAELGGRIFMLIGGEKRGLKRELMDRADLVLRIPYMRRYPHSLGSAGSTAVLAFEMMRRRLQR